MADNNFDPNITDASLAALDTTIAGGVQRVKSSDGREVYFSTTKDSLAARTLVSEQLDAQKGIRRRRQIRIYTGTGY